MSAIAHRGRVRRIGGPARAQYGAAPVARPAPQRFKHGTTVRSPVEAGRLTHERAWQLEHRVIAAPEPASVCRSECSAGRLQTGRTVTAEVVCFREVAASALQRGLQPCIELLRTPG